MTSVAALRNYFAETAATRGQPDTGEPCIGLFGNSLPDLFPVTAGFRVVDVKSVPDAEVDRVSDRVTPFIEPFVDDHARHFLHRLGEGAFSGLRAIVFCREDAAALVAYQYALELRRQGVLDRTGPELLLWNLEHGTSPEIRQFNERQLSGLLEQLAPLGGVQMEQRVDRLPAFRRRESLLRELSAQQSGDHPRLPAGLCFDVRHAVRYLTPETAADRLHELLDALPALPRVQGPRVALLGSALDDRRFYRMLEEAGVLVADLQPFGAAWPPPLGEAADPASNDPARQVLQAAAENPLSPRNRVPGQWLDNLAALCVASRCDWVVVQMDRNDDTFGWDVPPLKERIEASGIGWINLGFRDFRPDDAWLDQARAELDRKMGGRV